MKNQTAFLFCFLILVPLEMAIAQDILLISGSPDAQSETRRALWLNGESFKTAGPEDLNRMDFNLCEYKVIMICEDWDAALSDAIVDHHLGLEYFARRGGVVVCLFSGEPANEKEYRKTWQALPLQLKRVSGSAGEPEPGVIDPEQSAHPLVKRFANNYLGMVSHYGLIPPDEKWRTIAYTESSGIPIILELDAGDGKIMAVSILHLTANYQQKFHYTTLFRNIVGYATGYDSSQRRKKEFYE